MGRPRKQFIGARYGRLTVLDEDYREGNVVIYRCQCQCGRIVRVRGSNLASGRTRSCGCLKSHRIQQNDSFIVYAKEHGYACDVVQYYPGHIGVSEASMRAVSEWLETMGICNRSIRVFQKAHAAWIKSLSE